jgi:hypothetical protein
MAENASAEGGAAALCRIALAKGLLEPLICALIDEEVQTRKWDWLPWAKNGLTSLFGSIRHLVPIKYPSYSLFGVHHADTGRRLRSGHDRR